MKKILFLIVSALFLTINCWGQGIAANAPNQKLETPFFYFDNPDSTIEMYPEYGIAGMDDRVMSISSSKYANPLKAEMKNATDQKWLMMFFGRKTRTTVFVFDGQESAKGGMTTASVYTGTLIGFWGALWEGMRDKVGKALDDAKIAHTKKGSYKDYIKQEPPVEMNFNGHEGGRIVWKMDMSDSWISLIAATNIDLVFDLYTYYDKEYDKIVCVLFTYSELKEPVTRDGKLASGIMKAVNAFSGTYDETTGQTAMASLFEHRDMIDYFKKHFHLKKTANTCVAKTFGPKNDPKVILCEDTIRLINIGEPPQGPPGFPPPPQDTTIIGGGGGGGLPPPPGQPGNKKTIFGVVDQEETIERPLEEDAKNIYMLQASYGSKNGVIAVEKSTGKVFEVVPVKTKQDHPTIYSIGSDGKNLYLDVQGIGIIRYDGKSIDSSEKLVSDPDFKPGWTGSPFKRIIFSPNGRYMAYVGERAKVYDLQYDKKCIKETYECGAASQVLTDDGDLFSVDAYRIIVARNNGNKDEGTTTTASVSDVTGGAPCQLHIVGNEVFITGGKKLLKTDMKKFDWKSVSNMPDKENFKISEMNGDGRGFAVTDAGGNFKVHATFDTTGATPKLTGKLTTPFKNQYNQVVDTHNVTSLHYDHTGNLWLQYALNGYLIYNPEGIVGLSEVAGKYRLYK